MRIIEATNLCPWALNKIKPSSRKSSTIPNIPDLSLSCCVPHFYPIHFPSIPSYPFSSSCDFIVFWTGDFLHSFLVSVAVHYSFLSRISPLFPISSRLSITHPLP